MGIKQGVIGELRHESSATKKILERVPMENALWKPHEKSMTIGRLATHIAENTNWIARILSANEYDLLAAGFNPYTASSNEELLGIFQRNLDAAIEALEKSDDADFDKIWTLKKGENIMYQIPVKVAIRSMSLSHSYHHRGQLTVYLRLLEIPVPGLYGPSADER